MPRSSSNAMTHETLFAGARAVLTMISSTDISEFEVVRDDVRIYVRRFEMDEAPVAASVPAAEVAEQPVVAEPHRPATLVEVVSPLTGVYYGAPSPNAKPFLQEGDMVIPEQTVCLIEAMKVFNAISSKVAGRVVRILAKSGELVRSGQVLVEIDTAFND